MITHLKISPNPSLKKRGTIENLKSFYILETPSFEKGGLGRILKCFSEAHWMNECVVVSGEFFDLNNF